MFIENTSREFQIFNSLIGYGEATSKIWFIGTEEHGSVEREVDWEIEIGKIKKYEIISNFKFAQLDVRIGNFNDDPNGDWIGYHRCSMVLAKYLNVNLKNACAMLGKKKNLFTNVLPIPNVIENRNQDPALFEKRMGISLDEYKENIVSWRARLFSAAIMKFRPSDVVIFARQNISKQFLTCLLESLMNVDDKLCYFPRIFWVSHCSNQGLNRSGVTETEWVESITSNF